MEIPDGRRSVSDIFLISVIGVAIVLALTAPLGPVNIICINRTLSHGFLMGALSAAGAIAGDIIFASIAAFGLREISEIVSRYSSLIQWIGGPILILIGLRIMTRDPAPMLEASADGAMEGLKRAIAATFVLTITNPGAMIGYIAIFTALAQFIDHPFDRYEAVALIASVVSGAILWWVSLAAVISVIRHRLSRRTLKWINIASGAVLLGLGVFVIFRVVRDAGAQAVPF